MSLDFALYTSSGRYHLAVPARDVQFSANRRGPAMASAFFAMPEAERFRLYNHIGLLFAVIYDGGDIIWRGRVEGVAINRNGATVRAYGLQRAFSDMLYTALWSQSTTGGWREVTAEDVANRTPRRYEMDNNNRLYLALRQGEAYGNGVDIGEMTYAAPHGGARNIVAFSASYNITLPTNWQFRLCTRADDFSSESVIQTITGNGSEQTGTINQTFAGAARLMVQLRNNTGSSYTMSSSTETFYARLTNVRIKTTTATSVLASDIAAHLVSLASAKQITNSRITATTTDLLDEIYEDARPTDVLDYLALRESFVWGVDNRGVFYFQSRSTQGNTWYIDATNLELERDLDAIYNSIYAVYNDANNRRRRTASAENALSANMYGVTRQQSVRVTTTSETQAEVHRDALLADASFYAMRALVEFSIVFDAQSQRSELWRVRPGDKMIIRNLSPLVATPELSSFIINRTEYDAESNTLSVEPDVPVPTLVTLLAQRGNA